MSFKKYDGSVWQSINPKKLKGIPYTGTLPAVLAGTKAGYLHRYKVYGNTSQEGTPTPENPIYQSECGERTGNLFDEQYPDIMPSTITYKPLQVGSGFFTLSTTTPIYSTSALLFFLPGIATSGASLSNNVYNGVSRTVESINGYVTIGYRIMNQDSPANYNTMLNSGSTALPYEPYGYKLPLTSGSTPVDIYIGDDTLSTEEYVDSGTGKIYHMVDGTLTPIDPPMPFPALPTTAGSTTIDWAGSGLAPSQFDSVQEWVDVPTYKRVNGAWVEDN